MTAAAFPIDCDGIWAELLRPRPGAARRAALFLDRDGVILEEVGYLSRARETRLIDGAARVIARANGRGVPVVVVSNQSGIGRGYFGWSEFAAVQERMIADLAVAGARLDAVFASPHHRSAAPPFGHIDHPARKPNPGMLLRAARMLSLDLGASWIVGDHATDLGAGRNAGLAGGIHVLTGHGTHEGQRRDALALARDGYRVFAADALADAPALLPLLEG